MRRAVLIVLLFLAAPTSAGAWVGAWRTGVEGPYPYATLGPAQYAFAGDQAVDQTMRMIVHLRAGGPRLRVRLSNAFGNAPVRLDGLRVALSAGGAAVDPATDRPLRFGGDAAVSIPLGEEAVSDPVALPTHADDELAITFHVPGESGPMTWHGTAFSVNYASGQHSGDVGDDTTGEALGIPLQSWFYLSGVDVDGSDVQSVVVGLGDSLTDGFLTTPNRNDRYTDLLGQRLGPAFSVVNQGISGNSISRARNHETDPYAGPPGVERLQRDVLDVPGVDTLIVFEGINDLSIGALPMAVEAALTDVTERAHAAGVCVIGATLTPRSDLYLPYSWDPALYEPRRAEINAWMRSAAAPFDALVDFDALLRDPNNPRRLAPEYDAGDGVHFTVAARRAMAAAIPVGVLRRCAEEPVIVAPRCTPRAVVRLPRGLRHATLRFNGHRRRVARGDRRVVLRPKRAGRVVVRVRGRRRARPYRARLVYRICPRPRPAAPQRPARRP